MKLLRFKEVQNYVPQNYCGDKRRKIVRTQFNKKNKLNKFYTNIDNKEGCFKYPKNSL